MLKPKCAVQNYDWGIKGGCEVRDDTPFSTPNNARPTHAAARTSLRGERPSSLAINNAHQRSTKFWTRRTRNTCVVGGKGFLSLLHNEI